MTFVAGLSLFAGTLRAQVEVVDAERFAAIGDKDLKVEKLGGGMMFTEGPVWLEKEGVLVFSDIPANKWYQWSPEKGVSERGPSEAANGNTVDLEGRLISCQHDGRNVIRHEPGGGTKVLADKFDGKRFNSPNDVVVKSDGTIWFTDPSYGLRDGKGREIDGNFVYRLDPVSGAITLVSREFEMPNGLAFSPDEKRLYIADSGRPQRVGAFAVREDGTLSEAEFWLEGGSDGMRVDSAGNLYTTAGDGVRIYGSDGRRIATIRIPEGPANCAFGGSDFRTLFVTARTSLYRVPLKIAGAKPPVRK